MNRRMLTGIGVSLLVAASLVAVGAVAYRAGERDDDVRVARELVVGDEGTRTVIVSDGWRDGWHGGPGFLFFPLLVIGLIILFSARRGRWGGPWQVRDDAWREWHRREHAAGAATSPSAPPTGDVPPGSPPSEA